MIGDLRGVAQAVGDPGEPVGGRVVTELHGLARGVGERFGRAVAAVVLVDLSRPVGAVLRHLDRGGVVGEGGGVAVSVGLGDDAGRVGAGQVAHGVGLGVGGVAGRTLHRGDLVMPLHQMVIPFLPGVAEGRGLAHGVGYRAQCPDVFVVRAMLFVGEIHMPSGLVGHPHQPGELAELLVGEVQGTAQAVLHPAGEESIIRGVGVDELVAVAVHDALDAPHLVDLLEDVHLLADGVHQVEIVAGFLERPGHGIDAGHKWRARFPVVGHPFEADDIAVGDLDGDKGETGRALPFQVFPGAPPETDGQGFGPEHLVEVGAVAQGEAQVHGPAQGEEGHVEVIGAVVGGHRIAGVQAASVRSVAATAVIASLGGDMKGRRAWRRRRRSAPDVGVIAQVTLGRRQGPGVGRPRPCQAAQHQAEHEEDLKPGMQSFG